MDNTKLYLAMGYADRISNELAAALAFAAKHDESLAWDVDYHVDVARQFLEDMAVSFGYRVTSVSALEKTI